MFKLWNITTVSILGKPQMLCAKIITYFLDLKYSVTI